MPLFTAKEYDSGDKKKKLTRRQRAREKSDKSPEPANPKYLYVLLHPELPANGYLQFSDFVMVGDERIPRVCKNGIVETQHEGLKDFLTGKGYQLLDRRKIA